MSIKSYFRKIFILILLVFLAGIITLGLVSYKNTLNIFDNLVSKLIYPKITKILIEQHNSIINLIQHNEVLLFKNIKQKLEKDVNIAYDTAYSIFEEYINDDPSIGKDKIKKIIKNINKKNDKCCFFIFNTNGKVILDSVSPENEGKNISDEFINRAIRMILLKHKGFLRYNDPYTKKRKIAYFRLFEPYNWIISSGAFYKVFLDEFKNRIVDTFDKIILAENTGLIVLEGNKEIYNKTGIEVTEFDFNKLKAGLNTKRNYLFYVSILPEFNWKLITFFNKKSIADEIESIKSKTFIVSNLIISVILISLVMFIILFLINRRFKRIFMIEFNKFQKSFKELHDFFTEMEVDKFKIEEFKELAIDRNNIAMSLKETFYAYEYKDSYFKKIVENIGSGVAIVNFDKKIEFCNNDFERLTNFDFNKDKDEDFCDFLYLKGCNFSCKKGERTCVILKVFETGKSYESTSETIVLKNGREIPVCIIINPLGDKFLMIIRDISTERALRNELQKFKSAITQAPASIVITDCYATIEYVNPFFSKITGYTYEEAIGNNPKILQTKYNKKLYRDLWDTILSGKIWEGEFLNKRKDGTTYWERAVIGPVFDDNGNIVKFVAVKQNITELKEMEISLKRAKAEAEIANKMKSEFIANMSHEIRTPMNAIMGFIELFYDTNPSEVQKEYLDIIKSSTENLMTILNDILDLSKLEAGKMDFEEIEFNLNDIVKNVINIFSKKAGEKGLSLKYKIDENVPLFLKGDPTRISQIINNLVSNAIKFTDKGEVGINIKLNSIDNNIVELLFNVYDTGIGIHKDRIDKIFDSFSQEDASVTRKYGGTGLGLTIVNKIIKAYNGKIWVESELGKGSRFYFTLKLPVAHYVDEKLEMKETKKEFSKLSFSCSQVLVAEDNITNQILIKEVFKKFSIKIDIASNGIEALEKLAEKDYDLIFFDWHMPEMDGVEAIKIIRNIEKGLPINDERVSDDIVDKLKNRNYIIIALTAAVLDNEKAILKDAGFDNLLPKPIDYQQLVEVLQKYLKVDETSKESNKDVQNIDELKKFIGNDKELLDKLIASFDETFSNSLNEITNALKEKDFEKIRFEAHAIKGAAYNLQFNKIGDIAKQMEELAKEANVENLEKISNLLEEIKRIKIEII